MSEKNSKRVKEIARGFINYLDKSKEIGLLADVVSQLQKKALEADEVFVSTPGKISDRQKKKAIKLVAELIKKDKLKIKFLVEPKILDGLKIKHKDQVWDLTLAGQLESLTEQFN